MRRDQWRRTAPAWTAVLWGLAAFADPAVYMGPAASPLEQCAAAELARYVYAAGGPLLEVETVETAPEGAQGFVLGTAESLPAVPEVWPFGLEPPGADGYLLHSFDGGPLTAVAAHTPAGVQHGVYGLLEDLGYGFYLDGPTLPDAPPSWRGGAAPAFHASHTPAFAVRGLLPWGGYLNSMAAWEPADFRAYIDALVQMRCNWVVFHAGDDEPFAAFEVDGAVAAGGPLNSGAQSRFGAQALAVTDFFAGTDAYFAQERFGAQAAFAAPEKRAIAAAKDVLRGAIAYAKARGLDVGLGFEIGGDPTDPATAARFEARVKQVLADYPLLDALWLWEPESRAVAPNVFPEARSLWDSCCRRWAGAFETIEDPWRRAEAVRLVLYVRQAQALLEALRPEVQLALSGWGGDAWLRMTDFFPGLDALLPENVALTALDNMPATPSVSRAYGAVSAGRMRCPVLWLEHDGDLWMPQPNVRNLAGACRDAYAKGCQGLFGLHWRTRAAADAAAYCARFAWNTSLTAEAYYARRARDQFGGALGALMTDYLLRLEDLGYRWVGGQGQQEGAPFAWTVGEETKRAELTLIARELRAELEPGGLLPAQLLRSLPLPDPLQPERLMSEVAKLNPLRRESLRPARRRRLEALIRQIDYVLAMDAAAASFLPDGPLDALVYDDDLESAAALIEESGLAQAMHAYGRRVANKGELGVLAAINAKAWADLRGRCQFDEAALEQLAAPPDGLEAAPQLLVLPDRVTVLGKLPRKWRLRVKARPLDSGRFSTCELHPAGRRTFALNWPERALDAGRFEYRIDLKSGWFRTVARWPNAPEPRWPTRSAAVPPAPVPAPQPVRPALTPFDVQWQAAPDRYSVQLTWDAKPGCRYRVTRGGETLGSVSGGWFEDNQPRSGQTVRYVVTARDLAAGTELDAAVQADVPELPLPAPPEQVRIDTRANRIVLGWDSDAAGAAQYYVEKFDARHKRIEQTYIDADYGQYLQMSDQVTGGKAYTYTVAAVTPDGRVGPASKPVGIIASKQELKPLLELSFQDDAFLEGLFQLADNALALGGRGWAELPPQPEWNPDHALTLSVWMKLEDLEGTPVLICKGAWQQSGYFLQLFRKRIRFYLAGVDTLDAGRPKAGAWQHVAATFGFNQMRIYLNGEQVGRKRVTGRPRPSAGPLLVGRDQAGEDVYFVRGLINDIRVYMVALTPGEIRALYETTRPEPEGDAAP